MPVAPLRLPISAMTGAWCAPLLRRHLRAAHRILRPPLRELSVALVNDRQMAQVHRRFMNVDGPTDVLTFPLDLDPRGRPVSGEVVVCVPEARRRARDHHISVERELLLYALHGLLHLCGYDDRTASSFRAMHRTEDQILTRLGVGPVFEPAGGLGPGREGARGVRPVARSTGRRRAARRGREAASGGAH